MTLKTQNTVNTLAFAAAVASTSASAQTLGSASDFDILVLEDGKIQLVDGNQLFGNVGYTAGSEAKDNKDIQIFDGTVFVHSTADFDYEPATFSPSGGIINPADSILDQANSDALAYISYLDSLTADASYTGKYKLGFSLSTAMALTVVDFEEISVKDDNVFSFTGRAGQDDKIVIRISDKFVFDGAHVSLTNLDPENVIWYSQGDKDFDLHKGDNEFFGTIVSPEGQIILGETDFTGVVIGSEMKLGSGFEFTGSSIPEPSSSLLLILSGASGLMLYRRRK